MVKWLNVALYIKTVNVFQKRKYFAVNASVSKDYLA